jgi:uncharacterized ferritin-like protein (DUF455 family)
VQDILHQVVSILAIHDPLDKAAQTRNCVAAWNTRTSPCQNLAPLSAPVPKPGRLEQVQPVAPGAVPKRRFGTPEGRIALLHAIAHIECNAIDLALDMVARFTFDRDIAEHQREAFISDWLSVADDEARHFHMIHKRLNDMGSAYGALPVHQGLWEAAHRTRHSLAARLAIAPMLLEARGLDVTPPMIEKLERVGDEKSTAVLKIIYEEEIGHVAKGVYWFNLICAVHHQDPPLQFQRLVETHFPKGLRPPFNHNAREIAGLRAEYYRCASPSGGKTPVNVPKPDKKQ